MFEAKAYDSLEQLLKENRVLYHFNELCKIPHPSFKEKRISDYLVKWAGERGLSAVQDHKWNVFITKPAAKGYENAPAVMLQAHIDMVCEKAPGVEHDFDRDPIRIRLDGDILSTGGRTTLGADDGIGVAYAMAILEADDIAHPPLEVLFTTAEEEDLSGAQEVDASSFKARFLINIDNAVEHELLAGSCGGMGAELSLPAGLLPRPAGTRACEVSISGLPGGHSGEDINKGYGNANCLLGRFLYACLERFDYSAASVTGGSFRLAIPREASAVLLIPADRVGELKEIAAEMGEKFRQEYAAVAPELALTAAETDYAGETAAPPDAVRRLLTAIYLSPNGILEMNNSVPGVVESSDNMGVIRMEDGKFIITYEIRSSFATTREYLYQKLSVLADLLGGECRSFAEYPSWIFRQDSELRRLATEVYRREFGEEIKTVAVHCGLECGCLFPKLPGLDAVSIGPDAWGLHSPQERLSISSTDRVYHFLREILAGIRG